jgi:aryl-alcohol dehydrogenase-like predicted oxidoreductase
MRDSAAMAAAGVAAGAALHAARAADKDAAVRKTRSYNAEMEYRRLGRTGIWVSAVCLGGHWKRVDKIIGAKGPIGGWEAPGTSAEVDRFHKNRWDVVGRCLEAGINFVDACSGPEILAYARALKGRREKMYLGYSWHVRESRFPAWRSAAKLLAGLDQGLREADLEYADVWRISALMRGSQHTQGEVDDILKALETARKQGKCRFTGVSSHDRPWLKMLVEKHPDVIQVILTPYTADSMVLPKDSLFDAVRKHDVGVFGIKPFASNSLFQGDSSANSPHAEEDDRRARLAIRHILANPAITAPIPGLISTHQVDNMAVAVRERRKLDRAEKAELRKAADEMWARLPEEYQWLKQWRRV